MAELKDVTIYTDGAAIPNPGAGGYGVVLRFGEHVKELSGGYNTTTNNRMELMAVIVGLEALKQKCRVKLHSDSQYIVDAINNGAAYRWKANGWMLNRLKTKPTKNTDLWERLLNALEQHEVEMIWVKGHAGIEGNERCDQLASAACAKRDLPDDPGYDGEARQVSIDPTKGQPRYKKKEKIVEVGQPCRKCNTPVIKQVPKKKTIKENQSYYFSWYLYCPQCKAMYMVEEAKREAHGNARQLFE